MFPNKSEILDTIPKSPKYTISHKAVWALKMFQKQIFSILTQVTEKGSGDRYGNTTVRNVILFHHSSESKMTSLMTSLKLQIVFGYSPDSHLLWRQMTILDPFKNKVKHPSAVNPHQSITVELLIKKKASTG